eukprot:1951797-Rhodomonas_salina.1
MGWCWIGMVWLGWCWSVWYGMAWMGLVWDGLDGIMWDGLTVWWGMGQGDANGAATDERIIERVITECRRTGVKIAFHLE